MRFKRFSIVFAFMLVLSTFFSSFAFAQNNVKLNLVSMGDSITYGWNLDPDHTKPSALAFPYLIGSGKYNVTKNISFPGWTSQQLLDAMKSEENLDALKNANLITLDIGNNDLLQTPEVALILTNLKENPSAIVTPAQIAAATLAIFGPGGTAEKLALNLSTMLGKIKEVNPNATIILYNMYNPYGVETPTLHAIGEQIIPEINNKVISPLAMKTGSHLANAYTAFDGKQSQYILPGDIHPTTTGHIALAGLADNFLPLTLDLTPSTTEQTKGPITIQVDTNAKETAKLQWLPGERTENEFYGEQGGNDITDHKFEVTENGKYTVFIMDRREMSVLKVIEITNITKDDNNNPGDNGNNNPGDNGSDNPTPGDNGGDNPTPGDNGNDNPNSAGTGETDHPLPNTATPIYNAMAIGLGAVIIGGVAMGLQKYRRREHQ